MRGALLFLLFALIGRADPQAGYGEAVALVQQSRNAEAIPILEELLTRTPGDLKARNLLGIALLNSGKREEAAAQFVRAMQQDPAFYPAIKNLAVAEIALKRLPQARAHFEEVLKLAPNDPVSHLNLGEFDFADRRYAEALAHYRQSGGLHLKEPQVAVRALRAAVESGSLSAAVEIGTQLSPSAELSTLLAQAYERSGDTQAAYDTLRAGTQREPENESLYLDLISLCIQHHTWDLGLQVADAGIGRLPKSSHLRVQRGAVYGLKGDLDAAERDFAEAARLDPQDVLPQVALALTRVQFDRVAEAVAGLRACRDQHPNDYLVNWILGETLANQGEDEEAWRALSSARRLAPREAAPRLLLGKLLVRRGDLAGAAREFEFALQLEPANVAAMYQLATVYRKTGKIQRADQLFDKVSQAGTTAATGSPSLTLEQLLRR